MSTQSRSLNQESRPGIIQAKLAGGSVPDALEDEADRIAQHTLAPRAKGFVEPKPGRRGIAALRDPLGGDSRLADADIGASAPLDPSVRERMEPRFGRDFSSVQVHTGPDAGRSARSFGAVAYTLGRHIVFADGRFAPDSIDGQRLLAHELTHVVQQDGRASLPSPQLKAIATRFQDEPTLDAISDGKKVLKQGDKGEAVIRVTTALSELGHYKILAIDENFDPPVTTAVSSYQAAKGLKGKVPDRDRGETDLRQARQ